MSSGVDFFESKFLFQAFDTEVVWTWELTNDNGAIFYNVVSPSYIEYARVEVTRIVQRTSGFKAPPEAVEIHVKLDFNGPPSERPPLNLGLLNFYAIRVPEG
jgi:hypothetical protein